MMRKYIQNILLVIPIFLTINSSGSSYDLHANIISPTTCSPNSYLSFIVKIVNNDETVNTSVEGNFFIHAENAVLEIDTIQIIKGVGTLTTSFIATSDFVISINGFTEEKQIQISNQLPIFETGGEIQNDTIWTMDHLYYITNDLIIPENVSLQIEEGTRIFLGEKVNIKISGQIIPIGTRVNPILFYPIEISKPWGGVQLLDIADTTFFKYCFFCKGGDNENYIFGHSESQPVIMINNGSVNFLDCYFFDNPGKAVGGINSIIKIDNCITSRCDTGGEYQHCTTNISSSWFIDIPGNSNTNIDDNDALYFYEVNSNTQEPSTIRNCYFISGMDDGIDHNGANLSIENCWIEDYFHEGIAASNYNQAIVYNTLIKDCEQGIEAGYGTPLVIANHCIFIENEVGIRFGDSYNWGCEGQMVITNSISYNNTNNIHNYDILSQGPVEGAIDISYCLTNDPEYNIFPGCVEGVPDFDANYLLLPGSIGIGLANNGGNLGLIDQSVGIQPTQLNSEFSVFPNPFKDIFWISVNSNNNHKTEVYIFDCLGLLKFKKSFNEKFFEKDDLLINIPDLASGSYFLVVSSNGKRLGTKKLIRVDQ